MHCFLGRSSLFVRAEEDDIDIDDFEPVKETSEESSAEKVVVNPAPTDAASYTFEAEVHKMLDIVVNSLYQNNDVFLRELISNASDALDKVRYLMLSEPDIYGSSDDVPLEIKISIDEDLQALIITDTGVGMTLDEMVANLGTVARSGTTKFIEALKESGNDADTMSQIGQVRFCFAFDFV